MKRNFISNANHGRNHTVMRKEEEQDPVSDLFHDDVHEKKKIGISSIAGKRGSRGYRHRLKSSMDLMSPYERAKYRKAGEIVQSNLFDTIIPKEEFDLLPIDQQKKRLQYWRENFATAQIKKEMKVSSNTFYGLVKKFDLPTAPRKRKERAAAAITAAPIQTPINVQESFPLVELIQRDPVPAAPVPAVNGLDIGYNGIYKSDEIRKILSKIDLILDGEESKFKIKLQIVEQENDENEDLITE